MPTKYDNDEAEVYFDEEFDYQQHKETFDQTVDDLSDYQARCQESRNIRTCTWEGQDDNLTKSGDNAFPFNGSSDAQVWLSHGLMNTSTAINVSALRRSQIRAYPRKATDIERSSQVSVFLKYLRDAGVDNFWREAELADSFCKEKALMVTYYGYSPSRMVPHLKRFDLEAMSKTFPDVNELQQEQGAGLELALAEMLADEDRVEEVLDLFNAVEGWEVNEKRLKKALRQLRKDGVAEIPVLIEDEGRAECMTLDPETEFFTPLATQNFQDGNRCWLRKPMTPQEILCRVQSDGWDEDWANYAIEHSRGENRGVSTNTYGDEYRDLIDVVFSYEKLIDETDGAQGIYLTIWSTEFGESGDIPAYAKRILLAGRKKFPFVVSAPYEAKTLYSAPTWPEQLKSIQKSKKVFRDSNIDESSYAISPSVIVPPSWDHGRPQPGAVYPVRPGQQAPQFLSKDSRFDVNERIEANITREALDQMGLDPESPYSQVRQQHDINRLLSHFSDVLKGIYEEYKINGPDEVYLRVTGNPEPVQFVKDEDEQEMDVSISFNSIYDDPDQLKELRETIVSTAQLDPNGRINMEAGIDMILNMTDPTLADVLLLPTEQGQDKVIKETQDDIVAMQSGVAKGAPQNAAQLRLSTVGEYIQSPTGAAKLQDDPAFQFLIGEYVKQLEFAVSQQQNAEIGKIGTAPATMGNINTQEI